MSGHFAPLINNRGVTFLKELIYGFRLLIRL
jgi:hypothetical protein